MKLINAFLIYTLLHALPVYSKPRIEQTNYSDGQEKNISDIQKINDLENQILILETKVESIKPALDSVERNFRFYFSLSLGVVGLLTIVTFFLQLWRELKDDKKAKERDEALLKQNIKYEKFIKQQNKNNEVLLKSAIKNIDRTSNLIKSLDKMFKFRATVNALEKEMNEISQNNEEQANNFNTKNLDLISEINLEAINICKIINRTNFKSLNNQQLLEEFRDKISSRRTDIESYDKLNANCYLLLGLNYTVRCLFDKATTQFDKAINRATMQIEPADLKSYYPSLSEGTDKIRKWTKKLQNICYFHKAIIQYNLGEYQKAEELFREALTYDKSDVKSKIYIPEAKFLGGYESLDNISSEFQQIKKEIEQSQHNGSWLENKDQILAQLLVRYGNCYFPGSKHSHFQGKLQSALKLYKESLDNDPNFYIAKFSYAHALLILANKKEASDASRTSRLSYESGSNIKQSIDDSDIDKAQMLLQEVFQSVTVKLGETTEYKILAMMNYILAICIVFGKNNEDYKEYTHAVYNYAGKVREIIGYRFFSPLTKNDLTYDELIQELKQFERKGYGRNL